MSYPADPHWANVKNLLHFDGVNGGKLMPDEKNITWTANSGAVLSSTQKKFGNTSLYLDGSVGGTVITPASWHWGARDVTIELWVCPSVQVSTLPLVVNINRTSSFAISVGGSAYPNKVAAFCVGTAIVSTSDIQYGVWSHIAFTRSGTGALRLYINGVLEGTNTNAADPDINTFLSFGSGSGVNTYLGYIADFRYTLGTNRYPTNFTPPTTAFPGSGVVDPYYDKVVLHCHFNGENVSGTFVDQKGHSLISDSATPPTLSATQSRFGGAALLASTSGAYQRLKTTSQDYVIGTADFCVEFFYRSFSDLGDFGDVLRLVGADGVTKALQLSVDTYASNPLRLTINGISTLLGSGSGISNSIFSHVAICRAAGYLQVYVNGVARITPINMGNQSIDSNGVLYIGGAPDGPSKSMYGYLDEFRFTKGVARYTTNFTPPTEPFPDVGPNFLSGTVFGSDNTPLARTVKSFRRSDSLLVDSVVSDPTTGAFELRATDMSEHYVVVFDDTKNALVYDHIVPVI